MKLSTGQESTLGNYKKLATMVFGENSKAVGFLNDKIKESEKGENEKVLADERQMIQLLMHKHAL